jgi:hypothetical protein
VAIDLSRRDLGLPNDVAVGAVAMFVKDETLNAQLFAQDRGAAFVEISSAAFEIGPQTAFYIERPQQLTTFGIQRTVRQRRNQRMVTHPIKALLYSRGAAFSSTRHTSPSNLHSRISPCNAETSSAPERPPEPRRSPR